MRKKIPTVYIVSSIHNSLSYTKKLLYCFLHQRYLNTHIVIVDDGSTDGSYEYIKKKYPHITLIKGGGNLWWTGGLNKGISEVFKMAGEDDFILTINNDCVFGKNYISSLVNVSRENERAIVGSLVIDILDKNTIVDAGVRIDWRKGLIYDVALSDINDIPRKKEIETEIDTISTKGTLYPIEVFKKIGIFNEKAFPHYLSDYEFGCRCKRAGYTILISYSSRVYNDTKKTGLGMDIPKQCSLKDFFLLLFSRRSRLNICDHINFIRYCCPDKFKVLNYSKLLFLYANLFLSLFKLKKNVFV